MFVRIGQLISAASELGRFKRLLKLVSVPPAVITSAEELFNGQNKAKRAALNEFAEWMASRKGLAEVLATHGYDAAAGKAKLINLYWDLMAAGAGQRVGKTFIPSVPLYDPTLLKMLLDIEAKQPPSRDRAIKIAITALDYVQAEQKGRHN